jgi:hypothetical protein
MSAPEWAAGMQKIGPGLYVDARQALHIDPARFLAQEGWPPTEANIQKLMEALANAGTFTVTEVPEP